MDIPVITAQPTRSRPLSFSIPNVDRGDGNPYPAIIYNGIEYRLHFTDSEFCEATYHMSAVEENHNG